MTPAAARFPGFPREGLDFLAALAKDNRREWFLAHKEDFERHVKAPMVALVEALNDDLRDVAPDFVVDPKKALMRMNRDVRFSKDKSPYRTEVSARFGRASGKEAESAGYYLSVSPRGVDVAGGSYTLDAPQLAAFRERLAKDPAPFRALAQDRALRAAMGDLQGERLVRVPKGFPPDHPAGDLLRLKQAYFFTTSSRLHAEVARRFRLLAPFVGYLAGATSRA
jgi:uncharacterized protein (TIGR02453 family)